MRGGDSTWVGYGEAVLAVVIATGAAWVMFPYVEASNLVMTYLLAVIVVARRQARGPSLLASVLGVAAFDFFFIPPRFTFVVADTHYVFTFATMLIVALVLSGLTARVRAQADAARRAEHRMETERLRSALLSAVSHDLRTPLATITGAVSTVLEHGDRLDAPTRRELLESTREEAARLERLVENLLQMTRLESGALSPQRDWHALEEVVGAALARLGPRLADRKVTTHLPEDLPLVPIDDVLIEQVLLNVLDNALKYSAEETPVEISATVTPDAVTVAVTDHGPGVAAPDTDRVFEKFYRGAAGDRRGAGLGLAICRGIVHAHGGTIRAVNAAAEGFTVAFTLPRGAVAPPEVTRDA